MSREEAKVLIEWGTIWFRHMWICDDGTQRDKLIAHVNGQLNAIGFRLGRGWQNYDPVIRRVGGRPSSYVQIATWALNQVAAGQAAAQQFLNWATDDVTGLLSLPTQLQDLAIITHLAEVGRGYVSSLESELYPLLRAISAGTKSWNEYRQYSPSLKYLEDRGLDWTD